MTAWTERRLIGAALTAGGTGAFFFAPVIELGPAYHPTGYTSLVALLMQGPIGGAGYEGLFALNPILYVLIAIAAIGVILMVLP